MIDLLATILQGAWSVLVASAPFMLFGFLASGFLKAFLPSGFVRKHLGENRIMSVFKAALAVSTPLYVCATASTPIVASLASAVVLVILLLRDPVSRFATR